MLYRVKASPSMLCSRHSVDVEINTAQLLQPAKILAERAFPLSLVASGQVSVRGERNASAFHNQDSSELLFQENNQCNLTLRSLFRIYALCLAGWLQHWNLRALNFYNPVCAFSECLCVGSFRWCGLHFFLMKISGRRRKSSLNYT